MLRGWIQPLEPSLHTVGGKSVVGGLSLMLIMDNGRLHRLTL